MTTSEAKCETCRPHFVVCWQCHGTGASSAYLGAYTSDEMDELGDEFIEDYRRGLYDRPCDVCSGLHVVLEHESECETEREEQEYRAAVASEQRFFAMASGARPRILGSPRVASDIASDA